MANAFSLADESTIILLDELETLKAGGWTAVDAGLDSIGTGHTLPILHFEAFSTTHALSNVLGMAVPSVALGQALYAFACLICCKPLYAFGAFILSLTAEDAVLATGLATPIQEVHPPWASATH